MPTHNNKPSTTIPTEQENREKKLSEIIILEPKKVNEILEKALQDKDLDTILTLSKLGVRVFYLHTFLPLLRISRGILKLFIAQFYANSNLYAKTYPENLWKPEYINSGLNFKNSTESISRIQKEVPEENIRLSNFNNLDDAHYFFAILMMLIKQSNNIQIEPDKASELIDSIALKPKKCEVLNYLLLSIPSDFHFPDGIESESTGTLAKIFYEKARKEFSFQEMIFPLLFAYPKFPKSMLPLIIPQFQAIQITGEFIEEYKACWTTNVSSITTDTGTIIKDFITWVKTIGHIYNGTIHHKAALFKALKSRSGHTRSIATMISIMRHDAYDAVALPAIVDKTSSAELIDNIDTRISEQLSLERNMRPR
jgi:hypothetical protein